MKKVFKKPSQCIRTGNEETDHISNIEKVVGETLKMGKTDNSKELPQVPDEVFILFDKFNKHGKTREGLELYEADSGSAKVYEIDEAVAISPWWPFVAARLTLADITRRNLRSSKRHHAPSLD